MASSTSITVRSMSRSCSINVHGRRDHASDDEKVPGGGDGNVQMATSSLLSIASRNEERIVCQDRLKSIVHKGRTVVRLQKYPPHRGGCFKARYFEEFDWVEWSPRENRLFCFPCWCCASGSQRNSLTGQLWINEGFMCLDMTQCRGQGYDGAANMSGCNAGLCTLITNEYPNALFTHCCQHRLNLVLESLSNKVPALDDALRIINNFYNTISASPKRVAHFEKLQAVHLLNCDDDEGNSRRSVRLQSLSETRWSCRIPAATRLRDVFPVAIEVLEDIYETPDSSTTPEQRSAARSLIRDSCAFPFLFWLHGLFDVLELTHTLNLKVQKKRDVIWEAVALIRVTIDELSARRCDDHFAELWRTVVLFCDANGVDALDPDEDYNARGTGKRRVVRQSRMDDFVQNQPGRRHLNDTVQSRHRRLVL